jgi:hypothetical protein
MHADSPGISCNDQLIVYYATMSTVDRAARPVACCIAPSTAQCSCLGMISRKPRVAWLSLVPAFVHAPIAGSGIAKVVALCCVKHHTAWEDVPAGRAARPFDSTLHRQWWLCSRTVTTGIGTVSVGQGGVEPAPADQRRVLFVAVDCTAERDLICVLCFSTTCPISAKRLVCRCVQWHR